MRPVLGRSNESQDPRILILDDSLSAVDTETEEAILQNLKTVLSGRTSIIVSHRISTLQAADKIIVLEDGRVTKIGSHEELVEEEGLYKDCITNSCWKMK